MPRKHLLNGLKKQRRSYSGKKKRHTIKGQVVVNKSTRKIICTDFCLGSYHDFRLFKESMLPIHPDNNVALDSGYQGIQKQHKNSQLPKKKTKKSPLTKQEKRQNRTLASIRVFNEHVIGRIKRFKIIADRYRKALLHKYGIAEGIKHC